MRDGEAQAALAAALESVLEKRFFIDAGSTAGPDVPDGDVPVRARLEFEGNPHGSLTLEVSAAAARSIAADFLAVDELSLSTGQMEEVVCEPANMICGAALSRLESDSNFRLGMPGILPCQPAPDAAATLGSVDLGDGMLMARLQFQDS